MNAAAPRVAWFGKLPECGDFVRSAGEQVLVELTDQWLASVMQRLSANPRWRQHYDACGPLDFAFLGTRSRQVIGGRLLASRDQSARRFPYACMVLYQVSKPREFLPCCPLALAPAWAGLATLAGVPRADALPIDAPDVAAAQAAFERYLSGACLAGLGHSLRGPDGALSARRLMMALGLLLEPLRDAARAPSRCLALPLPQDAEPRIQVAAFWLALAAPLLLRHDLELAMFIADVGGVPALVLGLDGANPACLQAVIDPEAAREHMVELGACAWVEGALAGNPALQRLSACLEQGQLGLPTALQLFHETFC